MLQPCHSPSTARATCKLGKQRLPKLTRLLITGNGLHKRCAKLLCLCRTCHEASGTAKVAFTSGLSTAGRFCGAFADWILF